MQCKNEKVPLRKKAKKDSTEDPTASFFISVECRRVIRESQVQS